MKRFLEEVSWFGVIGLFTLVSSAFILYAILVSLATLALFVQVLVDIFS